LLSITFHSLMSFFFTTAPTTYVHPLSLHDALPIFAIAAAALLVTLIAPDVPPAVKSEEFPPQINLNLETLTESRQPQTMQFRSRSEEHTSELQSPYDLVCRLLLEKKNHSCARILPR